MRKNSPTAGVLMVFAVAGCLAPLLSIIISDLLTGAAVEQSLEWISLQPDGFLRWSFISAAIWAVSGLALFRIQPPGSHKAWPVRLAAAFVATTLVPLWINGRTDLIALSAYPAPVIALLKTAALYGLVVWLRNKGFANPEQTRWTRSTPTALGPHQVTRLLCGHAILGGQPFRERVLGSFEKNWKALAPEFGVDIELVAHVAAAERLRQGGYDIIFGLIGLLYLVALGGEWWLFAPAAGIAAAVFARKRFHSRRLAKRFLPHAFMPETARGSFVGEFKHGTAFPAADHDLVIYTGFNPFVGSGVELGGWSFAAFVDKPKLQGAPSSVRSFTIPELYDALREGMADLSIPELSCRGMYFVSGTDVRDDPEIVYADLAARPRQWIGQDRAKRLIAGPEQRIRYWMCIQVIDWGGDLILNYFIRCEKRGRSLLVETTKFLLPPIAAEYRSVDRMAPDGWRTVLSTLVESAFAGPLMSVVAPFALLTKASEKLFSVFHSERREAQQRRVAIEQDPTYDFGAQSSIREQLAQKFFQHHFQKSDADLCSKLIERKVLDELIAFLDNHGIDTSDLRDRTTTILNSGILVQGGDVRADSLAVGANAQATTNSNRPSQGAAQ